MDHSQLGSYVQGISQGRILEWHLFTEFVVVVVVDCPGSMFLHAGFLLLQLAGAPLYWRCLGFSLRWPLLLWSTGLRHVGFSSHGIGFGSYGLQALQCGPWVPSL